MTKHPHEIAIDILSRRDNSVREMRMKLKKKNVSSEDIEETIEWLTGKRLLDDAVFAQKKAESIFRTKLVGPSYIRMKLKMAGVADETIETAIDNLASREDWDARAQKAVTQWQKAHPKHAEDRVRKMRFLAARGFISAATF